jgi:hypothetical protein
VVGVVIRPFAFWPEVVPAQIVEFPANLDASKVEKMRNRLDPHILECPVEPHHCVLENIVGGLPTPQVRVAPKRSPGEPKQPLARMVDECVMG